MQRPIGIDLGTTNSVVAYCPYQGAAEVIRNAVGETITPSVVAFDAEEGPIVGRMALQIYGSGFAPGAALFKRAMGDTDAFVRHDGREYTPEDLSALVLKHLSDDAALKLGARPESAVITVPAYFRDEQRRATQRAAAAAGLECLQLINEPTAAAISFRADFGAQGGHVLVYDLGGGTFDVSVLAGGDLGEIVDTRGDPFRGGADWDSVLMDMIADRVSAVLEPEAIESADFQLTLRREAEIAKIRLSTMSKAKIALNHEGRTVFCEITRSEFETMAEGLVVATLDLVEDVLATIGTGPKGIDDVLLVGGSTRMPMIESALIKLFGRPPRTTANPDEAVALGAALRADFLIKEEGIAGILGATTRGAGLNSVAAITDIATFSLGVIAVSEDGSNWVNRIMIPRGSKLPAEGSEPFRHSFRSEGTRQLETFVTQGESTDPADVGFLGLYSLDSLPGAENGVRCEIEISYSYDSSGVGNARARLVGSHDWIDMERQKVDAVALSRFDAPPPVRAAPGPVSILMVFDVSGSMDGLPIQDARAAAHRFVSSFDPELVAIGIGVVANHSAITLLPTQDHDAVRRAIDKIETGAAGTGFSNAAHPFDDIYECLSHAEGKCTALVLADGVWEKQELAITRARRCHKAGIDIVAIGFGSADKDFLRKISSADELSLKVDQSQLIATFGSIAQVISRRSGLLMK